MKIAAIIAEYNPFHNGHRYHIEQTRMAAGATHVVVVMSGNYTQRGDLAIIPKHSRTEAALQNGADLVIELPVSFALSSAERFAAGALSILNALGCVDILSFGSESGNAELLQTAAKAVNHAQTTAEFFLAMKQGKSYPAAMQSAVEKHYGENVSEVLAGPNNTLAVEYIRALNATGTNIKPFTIKRIGANHDEQLTIDNGQLTVLSASQLRKMIKSGDDVSSFTPMSFFADFADIRQLEVAILAKLRVMSPEEIGKAPSLQGGLEGRIFTAALKAGSLSELHSLAKTKCCTMARIRRAVLCCFLGITQRDAGLMPQYVRILGMNSRGKEVLSAAGRECPLPMDTSLAALMKKSCNAKRMALLEDRCTNMYGLAFEEKKPCGGEFIKGIII